jgi:ribosomal protein S12 methylthiotransferase accessory factor
VTTDLGVPAAVAIASGGKLPFPILGAGAHLDPALAVSRAVTEAAQLAAPLVGMPPGLFPMNPAERAWASAAEGLTDTWFTGSRLAPGRLYDVPVVEGWVPQSFDEHGLNPLELPL